MSDIVTLLEEIVNSNTALRQMTIIAQAKLAISDRVTMLGNLRDGGIPSDALPFARGFLADTAQGMREAAGVIRMAQVSGQSC